MSEKRCVLGRQHFLARFVSGPYNRLKNLPAAVNAVKSATKVFANERGLNQTFFAKKLSNLGPHAKQTDANQTCYRRGSGGGAPAAGRSCSKE